MSVPDPATTDWVPLAVGGGGGGVDYKGTYSPATAYIAGDVVRYNGIDYLAVNPSTGQTPGTVVGSSLIGTSFPASPVDTQEFILVDSLTTPTYQWRFRYVASITDANKWMFLGGAPIRSEIDAVTSIASGTATNYISVGPVILTIPRAGIYIVEFGANLTHAGNDSGILAPSIAGGTPVDARGTYTHGYGSAPVSVWKRSQETLGAGQTVEIKYKAMFSNNTVTVLGKRLYVSPVRVS